MNRKQNCDHCHSLTGRQGQDAAGRDRERGARHQVRGTAYRQGDKIVCLKTGFYPSATAVNFADEDLEAIVRLALEARRRVKEQQKRCLRSEFRNTHFSYTMGVDGVEQAAVCLLGSVLVYKIRGVR